MADLKEQHFKEIARIINEGLVLKENNKFLIDLCNYFKTQNNLFDENQFKKACLE